MMRSGRYLTGDVTQDEETVHDCSSDSLGNLGQIGKDKGRLSF